MLDWCIRLRLHSLGFKPHHTQPSFLCDAAWNPTCGIWLHIPLNHLVFSYDQIHKEYIFLAVCGMHRHTIWSHDHLVRLLDHVVCLFKEGIPHGWDYFHPQQNRR